MAGELSHVESLVADSRMMSPPARLNHAGITVPDIWAAIDWYSQVFGCTRIMGPRVLEPAHAGSAETGNIFGAPFQRIPGASAHWKRRRA
jgi:predicted enzyme related to lactoylglutathione lyase